MGGTQSAEHPLVQHYISGTFSAPILSKTLSPTVLIDGTGRKGDSTLTLATSIGDLNTVRILTNYGANVLQQASAIHCRRTPIHVALSSKHEHVALYLYTTSEFVRAVVFNPDGINRTAIQLAIQRKLWYILWVMLIHVHCFTAFPYRILPDYKVWSDLSYSNYMKCIRDALYDANTDHDRIPLLFASFGLNATVYVSADRPNYHYHAKNTNNFYGLWPNSLKYVSAMNSAEKQPLLSTPMTGINCPSCNASACPTNECVLLCYMSHVHQFRDFITNLLQNTHPSLHIDTINTEFTKWLCLMNQKTMAEEQHTYQLPSIDTTESLLPNFVLPPPILLSQAIQNQYLCTRTECYCHQNQQGKANCYIYPPLLSIPIYPLSNLTSGYHNSFCDTLPLDSHQKTTSITNTNPSYVKSKSNPHAHDIIQLHLDYIQHVNQIYNIKIKPPSPQQQHSEDIDSPGFSVPIDYSLIRYLDTTTLPKYHRPRNLAEKAQGFFSGILDIATTAFTATPQLNDGTKASSLDQIESITLNNIRYQSNRLVADNKFTSIIIGQTRSFITPLRMTEHPIHDAFTSLYQQGAPQIIGYERVLPILDNSYASDENMSSRKKVTLSQITKSYETYTQSSQQPHPLYPPIPDPKSRRTADLTSSFAPIKGQKDPYQLTHGQTCLCGAHTTNIQPISLEQTKVALNVDGRSLRITKSTEADLYQSGRGNENPFTSVLYTSLTPHTSIIYRPSKRGLATNMKLYDYALPCVHDMFQHICPPLNPSHDLSTTSNNPNQAHYDFQNGIKPKDMRDTYCPMGSLYPSDGSASKGFIQNNNDLGDIIISPSHNISIIIPIRSKSILYFTSSLHRVIQAKYPHYLLYSQWHRFTTRLTGAIQRVSQRRMSLRLIQSEINLLTIYHSDLSYLIDKYKQFYSGHLNSSQGTNINNTAMAYFRKQTQLYEGYLTLIEKYIVLRQYRLSTSQYTPGANILAIIGNVIATAEYDIELYNITNPHANNTVSWSMPHPGTNSSLLESNLSFDYVESILTSKTPSGCGLLSSTPSPAPLGVDPNVPLSPNQPPPPGSITLDSFIQQTRASLPSFLQTYQAQVREFYQAYPKLTGQPNGSILNEIETYFLNKKRWESYNALPFDQKGIITTPPKQPKPFVQPFTLVENFMLDTFLSIIPNLLRHFVQRIQFTMSNIQATISRPNPPPNPHNINYHESLAILNTIMNQANMLDQWLCLPETSPHFHTKTHSFVMRDRSIFPPKVIQQPVPHSNPTTTASTTTLSPTNSQNIATPTQRQQQQMQQQQQQHQAVTTADYGNYNSFSQQPQQQSFQNLYPSQQQFMPPHQQQQPQQLQQPIEQLPDDGFAPPTYFEQNDQIDQIIDAPPVYFDTPSDPNQESSLYPTITKFRYYEETIHDNNNNNNNQQQPQQPQQQPEPVTALQNSMDAFFEDEGNAPTHFGMSDEYQIEDSQYEYNVDTLPNPPTHYSNDNTHNNQLQHEQSLRQRRDSEADKKLYFIQMVRDDPQIILSLHGDVLEQILRYGEILQFIKSNHPKIWAEFSVTYPIAIESLQQFESNQTNNNAIVM